MHKHFDIELVQMFEIICNLCILFMYSSYCSSCNSLFCTQKYKFEDDTYNTQHF